MSNNNYRYREPLLEWSRGYRFGSRFIYSLGEFLDGLIGMLSLGLLMGGFTRLASFLVWKFRNLAEM